MNATDMLPIIVDTYRKGKSDGECEYTIRVMQRIIELDETFISKDHLIEILEDCKEKK